MVTKSGKILNLGGLHWLIVFMKENLCNMRQWEITTGRFSGPENNMHYWNSYEYRADGRKIPSFGSFGFVHLIFHLYCVIVSCWAYS